MPGESALTTKLYSGRQRPYKPPAVNARLVRFMHALNQPGPENAAFGVLSRKGLPEGRRAARFRHQSGSGRIYLVARKTEDHLPDCVEIARLGVAGREAEAGLAVGRGAMSRARSSPDGSLQRRTDRVEPGRRRGRPAHPGALAVLPDYCLLVEHGGLYRRPAAACLCGLE